MAMNFNQNPPNFEPQSYDLNRQKTLLTTAT